MTDPAKAFEKLVAIVDTLMGENGCPWDLVQTRESLKPFLIEEVYEVLDALDSNNPEKIKEELGDLLYQILFHSKISAKKDEFGIADVVDCLSEKMVRRHPHVFETARTHTPDEVLTQWEEIKKQEKNNRSAESILDSVPQSLPGLQRAQQLQKKAAKQGFDWDKIEDVLAKLDEEVGEFKHAVLSGNQGEVEGELGDILFVLVNIARFKKVNAEEALRLTNGKFIRRFQHIERELAKTGKKMQDVPLAELENYWQDAKKQV